MIDPEQRLVRLGRAARKEQAPVVEVSARVMESIRNGVLEEDVSLNWIAAASGIAAAVATLALTPVYLEWSDPVVAMIVDLSWGLL